MKFRVAKTRKELKVLERVPALGGVTEFEPDIEGFYEIYENRKAILADKAFHIWVSWPLKEGLNKKQRRDYEIFVLGYLYYFELNVQKGDERTVYFDWERGRESKKITIYLKPFYGKTQENPNSDNPTGDDYSKYGDQGVRLDRNPLAPPPSLAQAQALQDPPQIPPPPPPPRNYP